MSSLPLLHDDPGLLRRAFDAVACPAAVQDRAGVIVLANGALGALLARAPADLVGQNAHDLLLAPKLQSLQLARTPLTEGAEAPYTVLTWMRAVTPLADDAAAEPDARAAVLGQLASMLAHQIRNPLGAISNALALLRRHLPAGSSAIATEALSIAQEEVWVANRAISDLLDYSRTGQPNLYPAGTPTGDADTTGAAAPDAPTKT